jgi:hypothetical protein
MVLQEHRVLMEHLGHLAMVLLAQVVRTVHLELQVLMDLRAHQVKMEHLVQVE